MHIFLPYKEIAYFKFCVKYLKQIIILFRHLYNLQFTHL